jgi:hypothetical protein
MRSDIFLKGLFVQDKEYERGPMIVHSEEEWRRRSDFQRKRHIRFQIVTTAVFMLWPLLFLVLIVLIPKTREDPVITGLLMLTLVISVLLIGYSRMLIRKFDRGPLIGLYEKGFQYTWEDFYPYKEIDRVELGDDGLRMWLRVGPEGTSYQWGPRKRVVGDLGEEGVEELKRRVQTPGSPE